MNNTQPIVAVACEMPVINASAGLTAMDFQALSLKLHKVQVELLEHCREQEAEIEKLKNQLACARQWVGVAGYHWDAQEEVYVNEDDEDEDDE